MKLLIILEKADVNDERFMYINGQIRDFARAAESMVVLCLEKKTDFQMSNTRIISLGKEQGLSRFSYFIKFYRAIWEERKNYDKVIVYRNPQYIVLGGILWKILRKPIIFWYNHTFKNTTLRIASKMADTIVSPDKSGFPLITEKLHTENQEEIIEVVNKAL